MPLDVLEQYWTANNCDYTPSMVSKYLIVFYFSHYAIALVIFFVGLLYTRELYLLLLSLGITLNYWFNALLRWAFLMPVPTATCGTGSVYCIDRSSPYNACGEPPFPVPSPPGATCGAAPLPDCLPCVPCGAERLPRPSSSLTRLTGMPALEPQLTAFTVASIGIFAMQWQRSHIRIYHVVLLLVFYAAVMFTHVYFNFNDTAQVMAGAAFGVGFAVVWQAFVFWVAYPRFDRVLRWPLVRYAGYHDTLTRSYDPVPGDPPPMANAVEFDEQWSDELELTYKHYAAEMKNIKTTKAT